MFVVLHWGVFVFVVLFSAVFVVSFCDVWHVVCGMRRVVCIEYEYHRE